MRIAFDARSVYRGMGGIGRYASCLIKELGELDGQHEYVAYFTQLDPPPSFRFPAQWNCRRLDAGMIDERFDQLVLPGLLEDDRIDLYFNPTFAIPLLRTRSRTVATVHDVVFRRHPAYVQPRLRSYLDRATEWSCRRADRLITVSEFSKREILDLYAPVNPIQVIPNGVHLPSIASPDALRRLKLDGTQFLLYVGSLEPKKNILGLLEAFAAVVTELPAPDLTLVLVGSHDPQAYPLDSRLRELRIAGRVRLLGHVPDPDLEALYAGAEIFAYPSLYEGFGLPALEAMARGVPTIVLDSSSLPEVVGDAAVVAAPGSLTQAIMDLAKDASKRDGLRRRGRERAAQFSWRRSAQQHLEAFTSVLGAA